MPRHIDMEVILEEIATEDSMMLQPHTLMYYALLGETHNRETAYELASDYHTVLASGFKAQRYGVALDTRRQTLRNNACQKLQDIAGKRAGIIADRWMSWMPHIDGSSKLELSKRVKALEQLATEDDKNLIAVLGIKTVKKDSSDLFKIEYYSEIAIVKARRELAKILIEQTELLPMMKREATNA